MKTKSPIYLLLLITAITCHGALRSVKAQTLPAQCQVGRTAPPIGFWTWPANSRVDVYLLATDFSVDYEAAVQLAVRNWNNSAAENGSNVLFTFRGFAKEAKTEVGSITIIRGEIYDKKERHLAFLKVHSFSTDKSIEFAEVVVDPHVVNPEVLTNVMVHELGHSLGLLDCYQCKSESTAMGLMKSVKEPNGIEGPTACDKLAVQTVYRGLATRVAQINGKKAMPDPGEEPEADDTPIVKQPR
jgi:hypothetical protein